MLVGNMGYPLSQYLADTISTNEIGSRGQFFPNEKFADSGTRILILDKFEDDHLDYHESRRDYFLSKCDC